MTDAPDRPQILIADDQPDVLDALRLLLHPEGFATESAGSPAAVVEALQQREFDLLLMDLNYARDTTSGREGLDLLSKVHAIDRRLPIVVMTGWASMEVAIEALRAGVRDFVQKPWDNDRVVGLVRALSEERRRVRHDDDRRAREMRDAARDPAGPAAPHAPLHARVELRGGLPARGGGWRRHLRPAAAAEADRLASRSPTSPARGFPRRCLPRASSRPSGPRQRRGLAPSALCDEVNRALCERIPTNRFVTFFYGLLDTTTGVLRYANAGHNPPLVARADGTVGWLEVGGPVLGFDGGTAWQQGELTMGPGDRLVLYTDGIVEARDASDEEFGTGRLQAVAADAPGPDAAEFLGVLFRAAQSFAGTCQEDDQTVVVVARNP